MDLKQYSQEAVLTCKNLSSKDHDLHMILGIITEAGELADVYKKALAYGKEIDEVNVQEEIGDLMWYIANFCTMNGYDLEQILSANIAKLRVRYPERFSAESALNRDLDKESETLKLATGRAKQILFELGYSKEED